MRTNKVGVPTRQGPELSRRIKAIREALCYWQGDLAEVLGCGQQIVSNWENGKLPKGVGVIANRFSILACYLSDPMKNKDSLLHPGLEPHSPILTGVAENRWLIESLTDLSISPEKWDESLAGCLFAASKKPFKTSVLIKVKVRDESPERIKGFRSPPDESHYLADLKVHGEEFVQRMRAKWHAHDAIAKAESEELLYLAKGDGGALLIGLALALERTGRITLPLACLDRFRGQCINLDEVQGEDLEHVMGPSWIGKPEKFIPAMEFLAVIADWVTDSEQIAIAPLLEEVRRTGRSFGRWDRHTREQYRMRHSLAEEMDAAWEGFGTSADAEERATNAPQV